MSSERTSLAGLKITESSIEWVPKHLYFVAIAFVSTLLISNIVAQKLFQLGPATFTAGILVFPISYIFGDVMTEVYGFNRARKVIYAGFAANIFLSLVIWIAIKLPPAPGWPLQKEFETIFSLVPRTVIASMIGYLTGELTNSFVMSRLKLITRGQYLWIRTISSTIAGQLVDTFIFAFVAFGGIFPSSLIMISSLWGWVFKVSYEACATPITYYIVGKLKRLEGVEHFDKNETLKLF
jgi:hypothetical protein